MTAGDLTLSTQSLPPPHVERLQRALVLPIQNETDCTCGVVRADGSFREMSRTQLSGRRLSGLPDLTDPPVADVQPGRWLFAGIGRHHFGHFLVETLIRLWATGYYRDELDGLVIVPKQGLSFSMAIERRFGAFLDMLTDELPIHLAAYPTRYETLLLPSPGFGPLGWVAGTSVFRREMRARIAAWTQPQETKKLYISRAQLSKADKRVNEEHQIEALMRQAGYEIFYPEQHSIKDQLAHYMSAHTIVGPEGSAFHLAPFAMPHGAKVGLIQRRHFTRAFNAYPVQMQAFAEAEVTSIRAIHPRLAGMQHADDAAQIDLDRLKDGLSDGGFI